MQKLGILVLSLIMLSAEAQNKHDYKIVRIYHIPSPGGYDYLAVNDGKLYVSHGTQVNILDEETGDSLGVISNTNGVHGIAFIPELGKGYTSNGRTNNVTVFDLNTQEKLAQVTTGENPDAINYEPFSKTIVTCNGRGKSLSFIDPLTNTVIATTDVGGKPEAAVSDGKGKMFVNIEDKNEIVIVDIKTHKVINHWSLSPGEAPTGLAYDKINKRLFAGCEKLLVIINAQNGKIVSKLPIGDGCDGVAFNSKDKMIFTSNGEGTLSVIHEINANKFSIIGTYPTMKGARTIAIDEITSNLFLPAAEFKPATSPNSRPTMIPGSFQILVIR